MVKSEVDMLWDVFEELETTLWKLGFVTLEPDWRVEDMEEYCIKYGSRDADLWYVLFGVVETLQRLGWDMYQDEDKWWSNEKMDAYGEKWGEYRE